MKHAKYRPDTRFIYKERTWPDNAITKAPLWCSVDLRDGNQSLVVPMGLDEKLIFFKFLVGLGFKEIEIGFPAASETEFAFTRTLIEGGHIPDDVVIQVLTQAREHIMERTFEALVGVKKAVVHLYNSTSVLQRKVVFKMSRDEVKNLAVTGAGHILGLAEKYGRNRFIFEYSPESFTGTEMDYAAEVCNAVLDVWKPDAAHKAIINLPSTVEMTSPNIYADQIEYMCSQLSYRENVIVSLHTHNDRGCAVAASELGLMAGADRIEGTLFGNGERTGNADIISLALNMYSQGIDPKLNFHNMNDVVEMYELCTHMSVPVRHPYAGELVFTAFSGSHQDAINKGIAALGEHYDTWDVPYLPIDPADLGRSYETVIRINSQSGKGGVAYILENKYKLSIPKAMQIDFGKVVKYESDTRQKELMPDELYALFEKEYINLNTPINLIKYSEKANGDSYVVADITQNGVVKIIEGKGNGLLSAFCNALEDYCALHFDITNYSEHSLEYGAASRAITYMHITDKNGNEFFGAGVSESISRSSVRAVVSAVNKMLY